MKDHHHGKLSFGELLRRVNLVLTSVSPKLPLGLLSAAVGHPMLVELKNGETLNGHLFSCDTYMNLILKEVVQTSPVSARLELLEETSFKAGCTL